MNHHHHRLTLLLFLASFLLLTTVASAQSIDLKGKTAEDFDWPTYFSQGDSSTGGEMMKAQAAVKVVKLRLEEIIQTLRNRLSQRGDPEAVKQFDAINEQWSALATAEIGFVSHSWEGGSGRKMVVPQYTFKVYLQRIKALQAFESAALLDG